MALSVQQFIDNLSQTGLMSAAEVSTLCERLPPEQRPADGGALAKLLIRQGKLTKYQAQVIYSGKHQNLVFGEYVILDKLGAGGMGVVLKAQHRRMKRSVAIKILPAATMKNQAAIDRFYREVEAAAKLMHPNIVAAHDAGEHQGMHYLVMEFVDGKDLGQILAESGPLPIEQALDYILQAAKGLEFAHARGVVHRDIKPANLLVSSEGQIKILDMGLARLSETPGAVEATAGPQLTHSGQMMGTVDYMSPEQAMDTRTADHRADIYALGCTLFKLLTGQPLFDGDTMMKKLVAHREQPAPSLRERRPDVPEALDDVYQQMVAKRPEDRYQSMAEVIAALSVLQGGSSSSLNADATGVKSAGSSVRTVSPPTVAAAEETITKNLDNTSPGLVAQSQPALGVGSASASSRRAIKTRWLALGGLIVACLAALAWFVFLRGTDIKGTNGTSQANGASESSDTQLLREGTQAGDEWSGNSLAMKFCWCPAGDFKMGSPASEDGHRDDQTQHPVTLTRGFWLGKYEVSQGEWESVMGTTPWSGRENAKEGKDYAATYVSWDDAAEFCRKLTEQERRAGRLPEDKQYALPTEAQWEYACRAGTKTPFHFGGDEESLKSYAWFKKNAWAVNEKYPHEVGRKRPNEWGLHDMHGNVWEWCQDWYRKDYEKLDADDAVNLVAGSSRVIRGGGWNNNVPADCRSANRAYHEPTRRGDFLGFRVAAVQVGRSTAAKLSTGERLGQEWSANGLSMKFCWCPPGEFKMGVAPDQVDVKLTRGFWLGKYEVTQAEFRQVMKSNPSHFSATGAGKEVVAGLETDKFPVEQVTWEEAAEFCRALTAQERQAGRLPAGWEYRLPTEAQWEYACRAGTQTLFSFGDKESALSEYAWHMGNSEKRTHEVGRLQPNPWGLHDMHGNVWEWCRDWLQEKPPGGSDPEIVTVASYRVLGGGSWSDGGRLCRSADRIGNSQGVRHNNCGFRLAAVQVIAPTSATPLSVGTKAGQEWSGNGLSMKFCWCPPGEFKMGEGKDAVDVKLTRGFWLGKYEVTQGEYRNVTKSNPSYFSAIGGGKDAVVGLDDTDKFPVETVTWDEATKFCGALSEQEQRAGRLPGGWEYRLPTEAQWEFACRAGTPTAYSYGDVVSRLGDHAWYDGNSEKRTHEVGQKPANRWGLHDMHGNVWEWCRDWYQDKLLGGTDPEVTQQASARVGRGGSCSNPGEACRSAYRGRNDPRNGYDNTGFRLAVVQVNK